MITVTNRVVRQVSCAAVALSLNVVFAWAALVATATVPPLRAWEPPAAIDGRSEVVVAAARPSPLVAAAAHIERLALN
jgi:hypothetical protein